MKNYIFWHILELNNWRLVVRDQWENIFSSGILNYIENIYITFLGSNIKELDWLLEKDKKITIKNYSRDNNHFERLCLNDLLYWSKNNDGNILYIHSKGVSRPHNPYVWGWRKLMEYYLINKHKICIDKLNNGYDAVGSIVINQGLTHHKILDENHCYHFSGNFWWSKTDYIRRLSKIPENIQMNEHYHYWLCERWILQKWPDVKILEMFSGNKSPGYYYSNYATNVKKISDGNWQIGVLPEYHIFD